LGIGQHAHLCVPHVAGWHVVGPPLLDELLELVEPELVEVVVLVEVLVPAPELDDVPPAVEEPELEEVLPVAPGEPEEPPPTPALRATPPPHADPSNTNIENVGKRDRRADAWRMSVDSIPFVLCNLCNVDAMKPPPRKARARRSRP
jgi:hypothetical protein